LEIPRNVRLEPAEASSPEKCLERALRQAARNIAHRQPAVVSIHSIHFHSSVRYYCEARIHILGEFLGALEEQYGGDLVYTIDDDLLHLVRTGHLARNGGNVDCGVDVRLRRAAAHVRRSKRTARSNASPARSLSKERPHP
jgi:hypothetical protein